MAFRELHKGCHNVTTAAQISVLVALHEEIERVDAIRCSLDMNRPCDPLLEFLLRRYLRHAVQADKNRNMTEVIKWWRIVLASAVDKLGHP
jgi:hypothetical protein